MLNKNTVNWLLRASAAAGGVLAAKYLESKETREKLVSNVKEIGENVSEAIGTVFEKAEATIKRLGDGS